MKYSWKGRKDKNRRQEQNKTEWASSVGLCQNTQTLTSPPRGGEPTGTFEKKIKFISKTDKAHFAHNVFVWSDYDNDKNNDSRNDSSKIFKRRRLWLEPKLCTLYFHRRETRLFRSANDVIFGLVSFQPEPPGLKLACPVRTQTVYVLCVRCLWGPLLPVQINDCVWGNPQRLRVIESRNWALFSCENSKWMGFLLFEKSGAWA